MCSVKTVESAPSVWRIWYRERLSLGWLASASTIRGNKVQLMYLLYNKILADKTVKRTVKMEISAKTEWGNVFVYFQINVWQLG